MSNRPVADLGSITTSVASSIEQQGAATAEIARSAQQAALGTEVVSSNIAALALASDQLGGGSRGRPPSVQTTVCTLGKMTGSVSTFVGTLCAA